jgi:hypothetical protein
VCSDIHFPVEAKKLDKMKFTGLLVLGVLFVGELHSILLPAFESTVTQNFICA